MTDFLIIDASLQGAMVAVARTHSSGPSATEIIASATHPDNQGSAQAFPGLLSRVLKDSGTTLAAIDGLVVGVGPGSFTGIKVGLAFVHGLMAGSAVGSLPTLGVDSLSAASQSLARRKAGKEAVGGVFLAQTRMRGYFASAGPSLDGEATEVIEFSEAGIMLEPHPLGLAGELSLKPGASKRLFYLVPNWPVLETWRLTHRLQVEPMTVSDVSAEALYGMAYKAAVAWPDGFSATRPLPVYLRKSTPEERLSLGV